MKPPHHPLLWGRRRKSSLISCSAGGYAGLLLARLSMDCGSHKQKQEQRNVPKASCDSWHSLAEGSLQQARPSSPALPSSCCVAGSLQCLLLASVAPPESQGGAHLGLWTPLWCPELSVGRAQPLLPWGAGGAGPACPGVLTALLPQQSQAQRLA